MEDGSRPNTSNVHAAAVEAPLNVPPQAALSNKGVANNNNNTAVPAGPGVINGFHDNGAAPPANGNGNGSYYNKRNNYSQNTFGNRMGYNNNNMNRGGYNNNGGGSNYYNDWSKPLAEDPALEK